MGEPKFGEPVTVAGMAQTAVTYRIGKAREQDQARTRLNRWAACVNALSGVDHPEALPDLFRRVEEMLRFNLHGATDLRYAYRALFQKEEPK